MLPNPLAKLRRLPKPILLPNPFAKLRRLVKPNLRRLVKQKSKVDLIFCQIKAKNIR